MKHKQCKILPIFDTIDQFDENHQINLDFSFYDGLIESDYQYSYSFLKSYTGSKATFNAYRRELERFLQWSFKVNKKSIFDVKRADIEEYLIFCQHPPKSWIGIKKEVRFISSNGLRIPNNKWKPFIITVTKSENKLGVKPCINNYQLSGKAIREIFAILSSFFNFLIQENAIDSNPVANVRQKSKYIRKHHGKQKIRRLSHLQWNYIINTVTNMANENPLKYERTLFIISALYIMYLRISELAKSNRWTPMMNSFYCDHDNNWWFTVVGKGNKQRDIAVSYSMIKALKRWRIHLGLTPLPSPSENNVLLPKTKGIGAIKSTSFIRKIVQECFDISIISMKKDGFEDQSLTLQEATVHWLRHTGISDDIQIRPREHVRDDAGHSSGSITDKYIDIELKDRAESAKNKPLKK